MPSLLQRATSVFKRPTIGMPPMPVPRLNPYQETGAPGFYAYGGYPRPVVADRRHPELYGWRRYETAEELLRDVAIVAAGVRYFLNLAAKPTWQVVPAEPLDDNDTAGFADEAQRVADFVEATMYDLDASWTRTVRQAAMYRFHGFGLQEWTAKKRDDGRIGFQNVEVRMQPTITRWIVDEHGKVLAAVQTSPQTGKEITLPRGKLIYLVDDATTDNPEGAGWSRDLYETGKRLQRYLDLEGSGFDRDLRGIPFARAPIQEIMESTELTDEQKEKLLKPLEDFVKMAAKSNDTGVLLDSAVYEGASADGTTVSAVPKWDMTLLQSQAGAFSDVRAAIERDTWHLALILGVESLLLGSTQSGSRALSDDKSRNLYLTTNGTLGDIAESYDRDYIAPLCRLNGIDKALWPSMKVEDVAFRDVTQVTAALRDVAMAGAPIEPDDPVVDDVRDLLGISRVPEDIRDRIITNVMTPPVTDPGTDETLPAAGDEGGQDDESSDAQ